MSLRIHPLTTGHVRIKQAMHRGVHTGLRRRAQLLRSGPMTGVLPIHAWLVEHDDGLLLVDTGETAGARDQPFATFHVERDDELDRRLAGAGFSPADVDTVVLTHIHGDHVDGAPHVSGARLLANAAEIAVARSPIGRLTRGVARQPLPAGFAPAPLRLDGPPFGAFAASAPLTADGRVVAVPAPGHTPGHIAIVVVQDDHHVLLGGDSAYDQAQLLDRHVDGVSPKDAVARRTMAAIIDHARLQPTVYLPSHDPESVARLEAVSPLDPAAAAPTAA
jgi:glyoxylase-like metal-dependent hydrolase (beta-lactamase superfamily II)